MHRCRVIRLPLHLDQKVLILEWLPGQDSSIHQAVSSLVPFPLILNPNQSLER